MKVLLVNGSPNKDGCTNAALEEVARELAAQGIETEVFWLGRSAISGCIACRSCAKTGECFMDDGVNAFRAKAKEADGFIFGTPVHYAAASGSLTAFMDRLFFSDSGETFRLKPAAAVAVARRGGTTAALDQVNKYFAISGMLQVGSCYWNMVHGMTPQELHLSVLERAFQGKLTEQSPDDGTGAELLETIKAEKLRLIKSKIIKKEQEQPVITDDDIPFDIPENWAWAYVGDIFLHNTGKAQNSSGSANGIIRKFITTSNLYWNRFDFSKVKEMPFTEKELERCTVRKGDLLVCEGGDCGRSAIWTYDEEVCIQNHVHRLRPYFEISVEYFYHLFYLYKFTGKLRGRGVGIQGLSNEAIHQVICPLPPLAEQKRIVAKLEEILPLCARLK